MTLNIERESLPCSAEQFAALVETHAKAMAEYAAHLRGVEADAANEDLKPEDRRMAFPPPSAHPLVEAAVKAGGFMLVGPSIEVRKQRLAADVKQNEGILLAKVAPPAKIRHWQFREQDIRAADQMRVDNHPTKIDPKQVDSWLRSVRPAEETTFLDDLKARRDTSFAIQRWAAKNEHDIDDLTEETVDAWKLEPFNG